MSALEVTQKHINWILSQRIASLQYCDVIGGNVHVCETEDDLQQIFGDQHGRWPNCTEIAMAWDHCDYLKEDAGEANFGVLNCIWNESGGPLYFVPRRLWLAARLEEHMEMTGSVWNP